MFRLRYTVFPVDKACRLVLEPDFPLRVAASDEYWIQVQPVSGLRRYGANRARMRPETEDFFRQRQRLSAEGGVLSLSVRFPQEGSFMASVFCGEARVERLEAYALEEDLFALTPFKGDNHMHTWMSDGKDSPMYMAAMSCRRGYDYCAITDHKKYGPSLIAKRFFEETGVDFLVLPGEEIHAPDNPAHIINLGGEESVNDWWRDHEEQYRAAVEAELPAVDADMGAEDRYACASCQVIFDRIRAARGVSVLCHPHWMLADRLNESEDVTDYLFDHRRFDALELIAGGAYEAGTQLQLSYYGERETMPVLGSSDAHGCFGDKLEPGNYTVVFAAGYDEASIREAIGKGDCIAGNGNKLYGPYRLVRYGNFLLRAFYPAHSAARDALGAEMLRYASARDEASGKLKEKLRATKPSALFAKTRYPGEG